MNDQQWGASPGDWHHFADTLGLAPDLLPVVSNPKAEISANSKMRDLGKVPSRYNATHKAVGIPAWTEHFTNAKQLKLWEAEGDYGICVQTRDVRAFDIDIADPEHAQAVESFIQVIAGPFPRRARANSGKRLLAFRLVGQISKRILRTEHGVIEFLGNGQQFVAVGTHPSGERYAWDTHGVPGLPDDIPHLGRDEFEELWAALVRRFAIAETRIKPVGAKPVKPRVAADANDAVLDYLEEKGWVQSYDGAGRAHITCPWEEEHSDAGHGSDTATSYFPAGVGGFQQGHFKCLHAHCDHRTDGDFLEAIGYVADAFDIVVPAPGDKDAPPVLPAFDRTGTGAIKATLGNIMLALRRADVCGNHIAYDAFLDELVCAQFGDESPQWRAFKDADYTRIRLRLEGGGFQPIGREIIRDAVHLVADENRFDSAQVWLRAQRWDGVKRIERFWIDYFHVPDSPYARACGRYVWSALAARALQPGAQVDMVPIVFGDEGTRKTSGVKAMAPTPEAFVVMQLNVHDDNLARKMRGKLVGELGELKGLSSRDGDDIREWITRTTEEWTPKYREFAARVPRRIVFIGTANKYSDPLPEGEIGRRWLPMTINAGTVVDTDAIAHDCAQLWAEGAALFETHGVHYHEAEALAHAVRDDYRMEDTWGSDIRAWLNAADDFDTDGVRHRDRLFTISELARGVGMNVQRITRSDEIRLGRVLRSLGFDKARVRDADGSKLWVWGKPEIVVRGQAAFNETRRERFSDYC